MQILDATTKSVEVVLGGAVTTTQLPFTAAFADHTTTTFTPGHNDGTTNGATAVTLVAAPAASTQRQVKTLAIFNADTVAATVTVRYNNNATTRIIVKVALGVGDSLCYNDGQGWYVITADGGILSESSTVAAHVLLGSSHSDTLAGTVVRGDLIVGNSTPAWARVAIGAANRVWRSDGSDPSWAQVALATDVTGDLPFANMVQIATGTVLGRSTALTGDIEVLTTIPTAVQDNITRLGTITAASIDHGAYLTGLTDDDHTQYALLVGRSGGQTLIGGTAAGNDLTLKATSHATFGTVFIDGSDAVELASGTSAMELRLREPSGGGTSYTGFKAPALAGNVVYELPAADGSAGQVLSTNASAVLSWATASGLTTYTPTLTDVDNTSAETTFLSWSVPANAMADFDVIQVMVSVALKNDQAADDSFTLKFTVDSETSVIFGGGSGPQNAAERNHFFVFWIQRVGTSLYVGRCPTGGNTGPTDIWGQGTLTSAFSAVPHTTPTFTLTQTYKINIDLGTASAAMYLHPDAARVVKF